jgi:type I restriction enzyme S subunit
VDIASVDNETKVIVAAKRMTGADAPSRARKVIHKGDLIVATVRPNLNAVALVPDNLDNQICSTGFSVFRPSEKVLSKYLFAFVRSQVFIDYLVARTTGANYPAVKDGEVKDAPIPVPPLQEQERIVKLLDQADELRKLRVQAARRATALIPALFHEMFGDPVANPKSWPCHKLPELCEGKEGIKAGPFGSSLKKDCYTSEGPRVYGQEQVIAGDFSIGDYHISEAKFSEMAAYVVRGADLLISLVGTIGKVAIVPDGIERGIINPRLLRIRTRTGLLDPCYLAHVLTSPSIIQFFGSVATGITMGVLNAGLLKQLTVPLPPLLLQREFAARVAEIGAMQAEQSISRHQLDKLFQSMLHRAFQGK